MIQQCCAAGEIHTGTPSGRVDKVHGLDCYIASPPVGTEPEGVVVILPDVFGWELVNTRILADAYAAKGNYLVYLPELQDGMAFDPSLLTSLANLEASGLTALLSRAYHLARLASWWIPFARANTDAAVRARLYPFLAAIRTDPATGRLPVAAAGFCWGGYWCFQLAADAAADRVEVESESGKRQALSLVDAVFTAHPANMRVPEDVEAVRLPLSVAAAAIDKMFPKRDVDVARAILERKGKEEGQRHEVVWYEGCHHGWAIRGNKEDEAEGRKGLEAEEQALRWFEARFGEVRGRAGE
ncbi:hypothetical protein SLS54_009501 [Diplodia seriata]